MTKWLHNIETRHIFDLSKQTNMDTNKQEEAIEKELAFDKRFEAISFKQTKALVCESNASPIDDTYAFGYRRTMENMVEAYNATFAKGISPERLLKALKSASALLSIYSQSSEPSLLEEGVDAEIFAEIKTLTSKF